MSESDFIFYYQLGEILIWPITAILFMLSLNPPRKTWATPEQLLPIIKKQQKQIKKILENEKNN